MSANAVVWVYDSKGNYQRQAESCMRFAETEGWKVIDQYQCGEGAVRNDLWDKLCADAISGQMDAVIAYDPSRISSDPDNFKSAIQPLVDHGIGLRYVISGYPEAWRASLMLKHGDKSSEPKWNWADLPPLGLPQVETSFIAKDESGRPYYWLKDFKDYIDHSVEIGLDTAILNLKTIAWFEETGKIELNHMLSSKIEDALLSLEEAREMIW